MAKSSFIGYVGNVDFHDGSILSIEHHGGTVRVRVRGASGKVFSVEFGGVRTLREKEAKGMMLYALAELCGEPPLRRFAFANWDENSRAYLEVEAETITVRQE